MSVLDFSLAYKGLLLFIYSTFIVAPLNTRRQWFLHTNEELKGDLRLRDHLKAQANHTLDEWELTAEARDKVHSYEGIEEFPAVLEFVDEKEASARHRFLDASGFLDDLDYYLGRYPEQS